MQFLFENCKKLSILEKKVYIDVTLVTDTDQFCFYPGLIFLGAWSLGEISGSNIGIFQNAFSFKQRVTHATSSDTSARLAVVISDN